MAEDRIGELCTGVQRLELVADSELVTDYYCDGRER